MGNSLTVEVNPQVLKYCIETTGYTVEEIREKMKRDISGWIDGSSYPTENADPFIIALALFKSHTMV
jgi:hypothetical protein